MDCSHCIIIQKLCHYLPYSTAFQIDTKKSNDMLAYLSLPSMNTELDKERGDKDKNNKVISQGPYTLAKNNSFQISTLACSTKLTHNGMMKQALYNL